MAAQLIRAGFEVERTASSGPEGRILIVEAGEAGATVLLDQNLGDGVLGTDLVLEAPKGAKIYLCTDDFENPQTLNLARQRSLKIPPKPLCFLATAPPVPQFVHASVR
ncbi:MAG: hypothetical protein NDI61_06415 [Bdellovibrionaceae bacterium]|nr:hypothetical protein [Pseudobdellovibrionaceae bacterium]